MLQTFLDVVFGCHHSNYSFPMTLRPRGQAPGSGTLAGTYVVCLECGRELAYDWSRMKLLSRRRKPGIMVAENRTINTDVAALAQF